MSEQGKLQLEWVDDPAIRRNFDLLGAQAIGRGPAQARVFNSANIATTSGATPVLTFNSERYDTGGFHSTSANTSRLTAPTAGLYAVGCNVRWAAAAAGFRQVEILLNGVTTIASDVRLSNGAGVVVDMFFGDVEYQLAASDYVEVRVIQNSGGALNVVAAGNFSPEFWIHRIGSQA